MKLMSGGSYVPSGGTKCGCKKSYLETEVRGVEGKRGRRDRFGP